jgi:hypothetical protein
MSRELFAVVEQILDDGHLNTESLAQLRAAYESAAPQGEPVAWQWLDTAHFRKNLPAGATRDEWRPLYA